MPKKRLTRRQKERLKWIDVAESMLGDNPTVMKLTVAAICFDRADLPKFARQCRDEARELRECE